MHQNPLLMLICSVHSSLVRSAQHIIPASSIMPTHTKTTFAAPRADVSVLTSLQFNASSPPSHLQSVISAYCIRIHHTSPYAKTPLHPSPQFKLTTLYASSFIRQEFQKDALSLTSCSLTHPAISMHRNSPAHFCANQRTVYARSNSVPQRLHSLTSLYVTRHTRWRYTHDT
jgi:hypothetical protein